MMNNGIDLSNHFSINTANQINKIVAPFSTHISIKHFRYLKLYTNGSRIILANNPDCTRFLYELGHYKTMWFDGEFPEYLKEGWYLWDIMRTIYYNNTKTLFEAIINETLGLYHGITYIVKGIGFYEIYTFDTDHADIYRIDHKIIKQFIFYFKQEANKIIKQSDQERLVIPIKQPLLEHDPHNNKDKISAILQTLQSNRYYLGGKYKDVYLTAKEAQCVYWLIQGKSAEEISLIEKNSIKTVLCHLENIRRKLNCTKQTQIVRIILETGMLECLELYQ